MWMLLLVAYSQRDPNAFFLNQHIQKSFSNNISGSMSLNDVLTWANSSLLRNLFGKYPGKHEPFIMLLQNNSCPHFPETLQKGAQRPLPGPVQVHICYSTTKEEKSHTHLSYVLLFIYTRRHILLLQWGFAQRSKTVCLLVSSCFWMLFVLFCVCFLAIAIGCQPEQTFSQSVKLNYSQTGNFCGLLFVSLTFKLF